MAAYATCRAVSGICSKLPSILPTVVLLRFDACCLPILPLPTCVHAWYPDSTPCGACLDCPLRLPLFTAARIFPAYIVAYSAVPWAPLVLLIYAFRLSLFIRRFHHHYLPEHFHIPYLFSIPCPLLLTPFIFF